MRRFLLKSATLYYTRHYHSLHTIKPISIKSSLLSFSSFQSNYKFFTSDNESSSKHLNLTSKTTNLTDIEDVSTKEFKDMIRKYLDNDVDEEMTVQVMEAIMKRRLSKKHEETYDDDDDELMDELEWESIDNVSDAEI